jgi:uncharacterized protein DUF4386
MDTPSQPVTAAKSIETIARWPYAWIAGVLFVLALLAESVVALGVAVTQNDSATKIATALDDHRTRLLVITALSIVYAVMFIVYLWKLYDVLSTSGDSSRSVASVALVGGTLFVVLHAVSDIGITGLLGAKLAAYGAHHDVGLSYALYLLTYALDSVGDVFGSFFALATGLLLLRHSILPRPLAWALMVAGAMLVLQGFGLGGLIASFGLVLDLIGFLLLLIFVSVSSITFLRRENTR